MTAGADLEQLGQELSDLLHEPDLTRRLDSLESVVVRTYLTDRGLVSPSDAPAAGTADTIEGWLTWVARRSPVS